MKKINPSLYGFITVSLMGLLSLVPEYTFETSSNFLQNIFDETGHIARPERQTVLSKEFQNSMLDFLSENFYRFDSNPHEEMNFYIYNAELEFDTNLRAISFKNLEFSDDYYERVDLYYIYNDDWEVLSLSDEDNDGGYDTIEYRYLKSFTAKNLGDADYSNTLEEFESGCLGLQDCYYYYNYELLPSEIFPMFYTKPEMDNFRTFLQYPLATIQNYRDFINKPAYGSEIR